MKLNRILFGLLLLPLLNPVSLFAGSPSLNPTGSIDTGVSPRGVGTGDVFGDGNQELIVANFGSPTFIGQSTPASLLNAQNSTVQIFVPSPGGLRLAATIPTASSPRGLALFRLGSQQAEDILVTGYDASLLQDFEWQGGSFVKVGEVSTLKMPVGVAAGSTRSGGTPFVAVADYGSNSLSIFQVTNGKLGTRTDVPMPDGPTQVAIGDLNGDGFNEIAVACLPANKIEILSVHSNDPSTYTHWQTLSLPDGSMPSDVKLADLNQNGRTDMVVADYAANRVLVYLQQPGGTLIPSAPMTTSGSHPNGLSVAPLGGPGSAPAIIVANRDSDSLDIFQKNGTQYQLSQTLKVANDTNSSFGPVEVAVLNGSSPGEKILATSHMRSNSLKVMVLADQPGATSPSSGGILGEGTSSSSETASCYPNPARGTGVNFQFVLSAPSPVSIQVFDLVGEMVWNQNLQASQTQSGTNNLGWNLKNQAGQKLASGLYLYRVAAGGQSITRKLTILH